MPNGQRRMKLYDAESSENPSLVDGLGQFWSRLYSNQWQIWQAFRRDLEGRFRTTSLGLLWVFILPMVPISAYIFLRLVVVDTNQAGAFHPAVYVGVGVTLWLCLADTLLLPVKVIKNSRTYLSQNDIGLGVAIVAQFGNILLDLLIRIVLVFGTLVWLQGLPPISALWVLPVLFVAIVSVLGIGIFILFLQVSVPDTENVVQIVLRYLIFVSLAIFPLDVLMETGWLYWINPFAVIIENLRSLFVFGFVATPIAFVVTMIVAAVFGITGFYFLECSQARLRGLL